MISLLVFLALGMSESPPAAAPKLVGALQRLGLTSALVVASQAVDEHPVWSPDGRFLALNVDQKWSKVDLDSLSLTKGTWHDGEGIGVTNPPPSLTPIPEADVHKWQKAERYGPRKVTTGSGTVVELDQNGLSTVFRTTSKGGKAVTHWKTSLENCHGLALSPDESLVAFVCELNGVIVTVLDR